MTTHERRAAGRYAATPESWTWPASMYDVLGIDPDVPPGPGPLLALAAGEDRDHLERALSGAEPMTESFAVRGSREPADDDGASGRLTVTGRWQTGAGGHPTLTGFVIDTTEEESALRERAVSAELGRAVVSHAAVDHAKGMLMVLYGLDDHDAFELLRWRSQQVNVPLATLARHVAGELARDEGLSPAARSAVAGSLAGALDGDVPVEHDAVALQGAEAPQGASVETLDGPPLTVTVVGAVDVPAAHRLARKVAEAWPRARAEGELTLDLRAATYLSEAGEGVVRAASRRAQRDDVSFQVATSDRTSTDGTTRGHATKR
ncbi:ANTAR domain-containing protein [Luteimicrobium sp. NPDC057192]|uniref:ANTAR domain-containing protein n=1 Tax=Luteimicrobium sp. NPDC057192 TaxID=3346042 RepID=UPI0036308467